MDFAQAFIFDAGWIFFAAWGVVLGAVSVVAFKQDILPVNESRSPNAANSAPGTRY